MRHLVTFRFVGRHEGRALAPACFAPLQKNAAFLGMDFPHTHSEMDRYRVTKGDGRSYLCTLTFVRWLPILTYGPAYLQILAESLSFCRTRKGLILRAYVFMPDHVHLIVRHDDLSSLMRAFKTWTSREISAQLRRDGRKDALQIAAGASLDAEHAVAIWQAGFHPKGIISDAMMLQKLRYVHANPIRKGFVTDSVHWRYSSAADYELETSGPVEIDRLDALIL